MARTHKILIACEFSGVVRDAFLRKGHNAISCDLLPTEVTGPHIQRDVLDVLYDSTWDLLIAHPPCTHLTYAGVQYWPKWEREQKAAMELFMALWNAPVPRICIENPRGLPCRTIRHGQEINPFDFGTPERKRMCLWLKNLPPLFSTVIAEAPAKGSCVKANGRRYNYYFHQGKSGKARSRFFPAIADAMAEQWGRLLSENVTTSDGSSYSLKS